MPSSHDPAESLRTIIENADRITRHLAGLSREAFEHHEWARDSVERCIERICEAGFRLGDQAEVLMPEQPWRDIRGMGNRLRHAYDRLDAGIVWTTACVRIPERAQDARRALETLAN